MMNIITTTTKKRRPDWS